MIERYTLPRMGAVWTQQRKYETWLRVELAACAAMESAGLAPKGTARKIQRTVVINPKRIADIERVTKHDVIAFLEFVAERAGAPARHVHTGLTSSDVLDTGLAVQLTEATAILLDDLDALLTVLRARAFEHKHTVMTGRSHGIHGEPMTFGLKWALWYAEFTRHRARLLAAGDEIAVGKFSGAMGTFAHCPPRIERAACATLGLRPAPVSNQVVQRDRHAAFVGALALLAAGIEKVATEIRHLQRTEVLEVEEPFSAGQKGSSAMPHKRNPVGSENLCGLARVIRGHSLAALENVALWHERDISHSSVERIILPDSTILADYMITRLTAILDGLVVYPKRMLENLDLTGGLVYSQRLLLELVHRGMARKTAYETVQRHAMRAWKTRGSFQERIARDPVIAAALTPREIRACFDPSWYCRHITQIYARVFGPPARRHGRRGAQAARRRGRPPGTKRG